MDRNQHQQLLNALKAIEMALQENTRLLKKLLEPKEPTHD